MKKIILSGLFLTTMFSCKKEEIDINMVCTSDSTGVSIQKSPYFPMQVGNYWIYQHYQVDTLNHTENLTIPYDSLVIDRDSIIDGYKYYVFQGKIFGQGDWGIHSILRVEGLDLINTFGNIVATHDIPSGVLFDTTVFYQQTQDTLYRIMSKMIGETEFVSTPFSSVECIVKKECLSNMSLSPAAEKNNYIYYGYGLGKVKFIYNYMSPPVHIFREMRLIKAKVNGVFYE